MMSGTAAVARAREILRPELVSNVSRVTEVLRTVEDTALRVRIGLNFVLIDVTVRRVYTSIREGCCFHVGRSMLPIVER